MRGHWRRLFAQLGFLALGVVIEFVSQDAFVALTALLIIALPATCWTVFALLLWTSTQAPDIQSLHEKVDDALTLALASTVGAIIGLLVLGRVLHIIEIGVGPIMTVGLGFIVVSVSIPALGFLRTWRDVYLPMVRRRRDAKDLIRSDAVHESGMAAMEHRLSEQIAENTQISQDASDHAQEAFKEANQINLKIARQGDALIQQGEDRAKRQVAEQAASGSEPPGAG